MAETRSNPEGVFVHPLGLCESATVGAGTRVWAFAHVLDGAVVGRDCNVCDGAYVESGAVVGDRVTIKNQVLIFEGVTIEDEVFLGPGVVFTNDLRPRAAIKRGGDALLPTTVRHGATLGAGVVVVCGTTIGSFAFVGAGAVITKNVPAHAFVVGNPGRQIGWACECGERLPASLSCACGRSYIECADGLRDIDLACGQRSHSDAGLVAGAERSSRYLTWIRRVRVNVRTIPEAQPSELSVANHGPVFPSKSGQVVVLATVLTRALIWRTPHS